jgi:tRNA-modifying protein YgfZ
MTLPEFSTQIRPDRAVISIAGDGVLTWLHNLITCDVENLSPGAAAYGALLSPQGKILHDMFIFHAGERVLIDCAAIQCADLLRRLSMYRLRAKLQIEKEDALAICVSPGSLAGGFVDPRIAWMGWRSFTSQGGEAEDYDKWRIRVGLADSVRDIGVEKVFPHEANLDQFGGVSFTKGCFVGQEVVSRMQHRGTARNRFLPLRLGGDPGAERLIKSGELSIGEISSIVDDRALALVRIDRLADATGPLTLGVIPVSVEKPEWVTYDVRIPKADT